MRGWKGLLGGVLGLIALQVFVSTDAAERTSGLIGLVVTAAQRLMDPSVPAIPDLRKPDAKPSADTTTPDPGTTAPSSPRYQLN